MGSQHQGSRLVVHDTVHVLDIRDCLLLLRGKLHQQRMLPTRAEIL